MSNRVHDRITFEEGKIIFGEGDPGDCAYIVDSGQVEIAKMIDKQWHVLALKGKNEMFGELALIDGKPRMAMARARTPVTVIRVNQSVFDKKLGNADGFVQALLNILVENARSSGYRQTAGFKETNE